MEDPYLAQAINLLQKQYLFQGLDETQLASLVDMLDWVKYEADSLIIAEGEKQENFYLILDGRVRVSKRFQTGEKSLGILYPGDYFGEEALLFDTPGSVSISALDRSLILSLGREPFFEILETFPEIRLNLSATAESRYLARKLNFDWLSMDEVIYLITRKHEVFLMLSLILPVLLGIGCIPVLSYSFVAGSDLLASVSLYGGVIGLIMMLGWGAWNWMDWGNDFYIVTSQRVVWQEKVIALYNSRREAPLTTVLAVNVISSFWGRILNYGNVDVRTFTGSILMKNMAHPYQFEAFIKSYRERAQQQLRQSDAKAMEAAIQDRLTKMNNPTLQTPANRSSDMDSQKKFSPQKRKNLREQMANLFSIRFQQGGIITYRKHWFVLLKKTGLPTLLFIGIIIAMGLIKWKSTLGVPALMSATIWILLLIPAVLVVTFWLGYNFIDWQNDVYQITPDQILDIERKPLGSEDKKTASLDSILSIEHTRTGILELILNFGNVIVNVGQTQFTFMGVYNPDQVHQDISDYMERRQRKKREADATREREQTVEWLSMYHRQAGLIKNQDQISEPDEF